MALQKQPININFARGLDTKTDPFQVSVGNFLALDNMVFQKGNLLQKRNGYGALTSLPNTDAYYLTTFNGNLTAIGTTLQAYSQGQEVWVDKGMIQPAETEVLPLVRSSTDQSQCDAAISANGLICTVYTDNIPSGGSTTPVYKYVVADSVTGQNIIAPTVIPAASGVISGSPRVFYLGNHFMILVTNLISATYHLQYIAVNATNPSIAPINNIDISTLYTPASTVNFDGYVANNSLYVAWNGSDGSIKVTRIDATLIQHGVASFSGHQATIMSVSADETLSTPVIYVAFYNSSGQTGYVLAVNTSLTTVLAPTSIITATSVTNITTASQNAVCTIIYEVLNDYGYDGSIRTDYLNILTVTQAGSVSATTVMARSVGLASKAQIDDTGSIYVLAIYESINQPTYFLLNTHGEVVVKLAYSNASSSYYALGLPSITYTSGNILQVPYLYADLITAVNKTQGLANSAGIYSQTGINLASMTIGHVDISSSEVGNNLNLSGGITWSYDGLIAVEQGFNLWPDYVEVTTSTTGGVLSAQQYFYQAIYSWTDSQGNIFNSAPSIPVSITTTGSTSSNTINIPTLRLSYKTSVIIQIYRWSTAQENYYEITSVQAPLLNNPAVDYVTFVDIQSDAEILGNALTYTTGGVIEDIGPPGTANMTLFQDRLFLVDAEDRNLLWYSKQIIESTPVEMSDLFTIYVAPTISAQGSTGPITALSAMDDKLIIFKKDAIYYINGTGPDNTGANSQFSDPTFITATVGCANQKSVVFQPGGLMFQSDKGIWLLGRDLSTSYIGAAVESLTTGTTVLSAVGVPATNQVRFTLSSGITLMYDYYYGQWGTFSNVPAIASTIYQGLHTYINIYGEVFQESTGEYLDGTNPVLLSFTTSWLNLAGLQGYERAYFFYLLGTYISPHKLALSIAYDYNPSPLQQSIITPDNYSTPWGGDNLWGSGQAWGGVSSVEQWRVFLQKGKCESFQITMKEIYDPSLGVPAGAGLTLSGLNVIVGLKKGYTTLRPSRSVG